MTNFFIGYFPSVFTFAYSLLFFIGFILIKKEKDNDKVERYVTIKQVIVLVLTIFMIVFFPNLFNILDNIFGVLILIPCIVSFIYNRSPDKDTKKVQLGLSFFYFIAMIFFFLDLNTKVSNEKKLALYKSFKEGQNDYPKTLSYLKTLNLNELKKYNMNILEYTLLNEKKEINLRDESLRKEKSTQIRLDEKKKNDEFIKKFEENLVGHESNQKQN